MNQTKNFVHLEFKNQTLWNKYFDSVQQPFRFGENHQIKNQPINTIANPIPVTSAITNLTCKKVCINRRSKIGFFSRVKLRKQ